MKFPVYVECLNRSGEVIQRHRFSRLPITIGRGYSNTLILDDPYIAPEHAVIELSENGRCIIRDLGSQNGMICHQRKHIMLNVDGKAVIRLGHTHIRIREADFPVEKEFLDKTKHAWEGIKPAAVGVGILIILSVINTYINSSTNPTLLNYITTALIVLAIIGVWALLWGLANRSIKGQLRFGRHFFIAATLSACTDVWHVITTIISYAFSWETLSRYSLHGTIILSFTMVFFHLLTIDAHKIKRFFILCSGLSIICSGLFLMSFYQNKGRFYDELYMNELLPPELRYSTNHSLAHYIEDVRSLQTTLDKERLTPIDSTFSALNDD